MQSLLVCILQEQRLSDHRWNVHALVHSGDRVRSLKKLEIDWADADSDALLEWYIEDFATKDAFSTARATKAEQTLNTCGKALQAYLAEILKDQTPDNNASGIRVSLVLLDNGTNQGLHSLPWELLENRLFWPRGSSITSISRCPLSKSVPNPYEKLEQINILVLTSRPAQGKDISYRAISKHIWEISKRTPTDKIKLTFVRPGTWQQFIKVLRQHGPGHFQVVHFDAHGIIDNKTAQ